MASDEFKTEYYQEKQNMKKKLKAFKVLLLFSKLFLWIVVVFAFIYRGSRIGSRTLLISCAIIVVFSMIAYERFESGRDNLGRIINQLQHKTKTLGRKIERITIKFHLQNVSLSFN